MAYGSGLTRGTVALTHRSIEALRPGEAPYRVSDQRCIGLAVRVAPSGLKTWDLAFRIRGSGKVRRVSLGRVADVSLEKARDRANELTSAARAGRDLLADEVVTLSNPLDVVDRDVALRPFGAAEVRSVDPQSRYRKAVPSRAVTLAGMPAFSTGPSALR